MELSPTNTGELAHLNRLARALSQSTNVTEILSIRDVSEAARIYARDAKRGLELQNQAAQIRLRAERKLGFILADLHLHGGDRKSGTQEAKVTLDNLGITKNQSSRWQKLAQVPDDSFEEFFRQTILSGQEITWSRAVRWRSQEVGRDGKPKREGRDEEAPPLNGHSDTNEQSERDVQRPSNGLLELREQLTEALDHYLHLEQLLEPMLQLGRDKLQNGQRRYIKKLRNVSMPLRQLPGDI